MENLEFETLNIPPYKRRHLRSQTVQSLLHILSIFDNDNHPQCPKPHPSTNSGSVGPGFGATGQIDGDFARTNVVSDEFLCQNDTLADENQEVSAMKVGILDNESQNRLPVAIPLEEIKDDRQGAGMALEKTILMHSSVAADKVVEGEIAGESVGLSRGDDIQSEGKRGTENPFSEGVSGKEQQIGFDKYEKSNPWPENIARNLGKGMKSEISESRRNLVEYNSEIFNSGTNAKSSKLIEYRRKPKTGGSNKQGSGEKESYYAGVCIKNLVQAGGASGENTSTNLHIASAKKDADVPIERKRPAPQGKENRANKKICTSQDKFETVIPGKPMEPQNSEGLDCKLENGGKQIQGSKVKNSGGSEGFPKSLPLLGVLSVETLSPNKENSSAEKADDAPKKKKAKKNSKKKRKEKMKLAEQNGKPAVKRRQPQLQPQPMARQKPVSDCRHYMLGRCKEGALCKFSHDSVPLTKSTPCGHFIRHQCMKGDQCPYDHDLSKYPCTNFQTNGSCSRGVDCLFSHKIQASESASPSPVRATGPDLIALSLLNNSNSLKQFIVNEKLDAKSCPPTLSPIMNKQHNTAMTTPKPTLASKGTLGTPKGTMPTHIPVTSAPKGMSFLSHGNSLPEAGSNPKVDTGAKVDHQLTPSSISSQENSENTKKVPLVAPRGINFLAFGKKSLVDVPNPNSSLKWSDRIGKSPLSNSCEGEKSESSLKKDGFKVDNHVNKSQPDGSSSKSGVDFYSNKETSAPVGQSPLLTRQTPSYQKTMLPNTPMSLQNVFNSTLSFASKFESQVKTYQQIGSPVSTRDLNKEAGSSSNSSTTKASSILELIYGHSGKT